MVWVTNRSEKKNASNALWAVQSPRLYFLSFLVLPAQYAHPASCMHLPIQSPTLFTNDCASGTGIKWFSNTIHFTLVTCYLLLVTMIRTRPISASMIVLIISPVH